MVCALLDNFEHDVEVHGRSPIDPVDECLQPAVASATGVGRRCDDARLEQELGLVVGDEEVRTASGVRQLWMNVDPKAGGCVELVQ